MAEGNIIYGVFWLILLAAISFWIAGICFVPYLIISVLTPCVPALKPIGDILLAGIMFPYKCSDNMVHMRSYDSI